MFCYFKHMVYEVDMRRVADINCAVESGVGTITLVLTATQSFSISNTHIVVENEFRNPNSFSIAEIKLPYIEQSLYELCASKDMTFIIVLEGISRESLTGKSFCLDSNDVFKIIDLLEFRAIYS